jgi:DNA-binding response OmpR family regulator
MDNLPLLLLVEDEPLIRSSVADALLDGGYAVAEAEDGAAAIDVLDGTLAVHGLITDIRLGAGADGWQVAREARQRMPAIAVVYMTGDSAADWSSEGVPNSIMVQKPFAMAQVVTAVSGLLNAADQSPAHPSQGSE